LLFRCGRARRPTHRLGQQRLQIFGGESAQFPRRAGPSTAPNTCRCFGCAGLAALCGQPPVRRILDIFCLCLTWPAMTAWVSLLRKGFRSTVTARASGEAGDPVCGSAKNAARASISGSVSLLDGGNHHFDAVPRALSSSRNGEIGHCRRSTQPVIDASGPAAPTYDAAVGTPDNGCHRYATEPSGSGPSPRNRANAVRGYSNLLQQACRVRVLQPSLRYGETGRSRPMRLRL